MKQNLETLKSCPLCGATEFLTKFELPDFSTTKEEFSIQQCAHCGFLVTNPRPPQDNIGKYYLSDAYISHTNENRSLFGKVYHVARRIAIRQKLELIDSYTKSKVVRLLDYGCGTGEFLAAAKKKGWQVKGIEIADNARMQAKNNHHLEVLLPQDINTIASGSVDVITLWHVLEHIDDFNGLITEFARVLTPNGSVIVAVPNPESYDAMHYGIYWAAWDVPIHLNHFKKQDIDRLAYKQGFRVVAIRKMLFDSFYIALLSEEYKTGRKNWLKAIFFATISNLKGWRQNTSSLTYVLRKSKTKMS